MTTVTTGKVRFSYVHIFEPSGIDEGDTPKFSMQILIPKEDKATLSRIASAVKAATERGKEGKYKGASLAKLKTPLRDGAGHPETETYEGMYFMNVSNSRRPGVVDANLQAIIDPDIVYSGCYGKVAIQFYPYNFKGTVGVAASLSHVQFLEDGDMLGGSRITAEEAFGGDDLIG